VRCVGQGVPLESYQVLAPSQMLGEDALWFIEWLRTNLREAYPAAVL